MKYIKMAIIGIALVLVFFIGRYIINNDIYFELYHKKIYHYQYEGRERTRPYFLVASIEIVDDTMYGASSENKKELLQILSNYDARKYRLLIIYGGDLQSIKMVRNHEDIFPKVKYKENVSKRMVTYYIIKRGRYIEFEYQ